MVHNHSRWTPPSLERYEEGDTLPNNVILKSFSQVVYVQSTVAAAEVVRGGRYIAEQRHPQIVHSSGARTLSSAPSPGRYEEGDTLPNNVILKSFSQLVYVQSTVSASEVVRGGRYIAEQRHPQIVHFSGASYKVLRPSARAGAPSPVLKASHESDVWRRKRREGERVEDSLIYLREEAGQRPVQC
jgi:hypothetical protein